MKIRTGRAVLLEAAAVGLSDAVVNPSQVGFIGFARPLRLARPQRSNYRGNMYTGIGLAWRNASSENW